MKRLPILGSIYACLSATIAARAENIVSGIQVLLMRRKLTSRFNKLLDGVSIVRWLVGRNDDAVGRGLRIAERESGECTVIRKEPAPRTQHQRVDQEYIFIHQIPPH